MRHGIAAVLAILFLFVFSAFMIPTLVTDSQLFNSSSPGIGRFVPAVPYVFIAVVVAMLAIIVGSASGGRD